MGVRELHLGPFSLLLPYKLQGLKSLYQAWQQVPSPTKLPHQPVNTASLEVVYEAREVPLGPGVSNVLGLQCVNIHCCV